MKQKAIFITVGIVVAIGLIVLIVNQSNPITPNVPPIPLKTEGFRKCICSEGQEGRGRVCQDTVEVNNDYVSGKLTEYTQLPDKGWSKTSPGDVKWPASQGCNGNWQMDAVNGKWTFWDFTQFGS